MYVCSCDPNRALKGILKCTTQVDRLEKARRSCCPRFSSTLSRPNFRGVRFLWKYHSKNQLKHNRPSIKEQNALTKCQAATFCKPLYTCVTKNLMALCCKNLFCNRKKHSLCEHWLCKSEKTQHHNYTGGNAAFKFRYRITLMWVLLVCSQA